MVTALANDYYLKALDNYPYDLPEFLESINYALSYDENHADAHCLMARFYMDQLCKYPEAVYHFDKALAADPKHIITLYNYSSLAIRLDDFSKASKLLDYASSIKGIYQPALLHRRALIEEKQGRYKKAKNWLKKAIQDAWYSDDVDFYNTELSRVKKKIEKKNKKKSKK